jgi:transcription termination/antitermination protein NusG
MQRNWYLICTKKLKEKRVTELLAKKGIESYCPFTISENKISGTKEITVYQAMFKCFVFVNITPDQVASVRQTPYVVNMVYWRSNPVIVSKEEVGALKLMTENYQRITIEKTAVNTMDKFLFKEQNITTQHENVFSIKHKGHIAVLPSLGYKITAQRERAPRATVSKESVTANSMFKKLNPLFLFGL